TRQPSPEFFRPPSRRATTVGRAATRAAGSRGTGRAQRRRDASAIRGGCSGDRPSSNSSRCRRCAGGCRGPVARVGAGRFRRYNRLSVGVVSGVADRLERGERRPVRQVVGGAAGRERGEAMKARIGFDHYTIAHRGFAAEATLRFARDHRFDGVQFLDASSIDEVLDPDVLAGFRSTADRMGLYVEAGMPSPNPLRRADGEGTVWERVDLAGGAGGALGGLDCRHARVYLGDRHDRFRTDQPWDEQLAASLEVIRALTPQLKASGIRLAIETHADLTADELLALL